MGNFIIIDNTANHRNCYTDASGEEWNIDNIYHADFFPTEESAQIFLDDWCLKNDGTGTEWAEILDADAHGLLPDYSAHD